MHFELGTDLEPELTDHRKRGLTTVFINTGNPQNIFALLLNLYVLQQKSSTERNKIFVSIIQDFAPE